jgi:hypothetical protein
MSRTRLVIPLLTALLLAVGLASPAHADELGVDELHYSWLSSTSVALDWHGGDGTAVVDGLPVVATSMSGPVDEPGPFWELVVADLDPTVPHSYLVGATTGTIELPPTDHVRFAAVGDFGPSPDIPWVTETHNQIALAQPDFAWLLGDLSYANLYCQQAVRYFFTDLERWSHDVPAMPVWGNHEHGASRPTLPDCTPVKDTYANYKGRWALPNSQGDESWGWFDAGPVRFISVPEPNDGLKTWRATADGIMAAAQADPNISFIVTAAHRPAYNSRMAPMATARMLRGLAVKYSKYKVTFAGHLHANRVSVKDGLLQVLAGSGGEGQFNWPVRNYPNVLYRSSHPAITVVDATRDSLTLSYVCAGQYETSTEDPCSPGQVLYTTTVLADPL